MKKIIAMMLIVAMVIIFAGCTQVSTNGATDKLSAGFSFSKTHKDLSVVFNGTDICLPISFDEFVKRTGYFPLDLTNIQELSTVLEPNKIARFYMSNGTCVIQIDIHNLSNQTIPASCCDVTGVHVLKEDKISYEMMRNEDIGFTLNDVHIEQKITLEELRDKFGNVQTVNEKFMGVTVVEHNTYNAVYLVTVTPENEIIAIDVTTQWKFD